MLPPSLLGPPRSAASAPGLSLAHSSGASRVRLSSSGDHHGAWLKGSDDRGHRVTPPIRGSPEFFHRACPRVLLERARHCRPPSDARPHKRRPDQWAGQNLFVPHATASRSTSPSPLSDVRLLLHGPAGREIAPCSADCRLARDLLPRLTSFRYSCASPRYEPDQLLAGPVTSEAGVLSLPGWVGSAQEWSDQPTPSLSRPEPQAGPSASLLKASTSCLSLRARPAATQSVFFT